MRSQTVIIQMKATEQYLVRFSSRYFFILFQSVKHFWERKCHRNTSTCDGFAFNCESNFVKLFLNDIFSTLIFVQFLYSLNKTKNDCKCVKKR